MCVDLYIYLDYTYIYRARQFEISHFKPLLPKYITLPCCTKTTPISIVTYRTCFQRMLCFLAKKLDLFRLGPASL